MHTRDFTAFPREHGAWGMLLQPFVGSLLVLGRIEWAVLPALACVLLVFLIREPLLVLARQAWVWRSERPTVAQARRWLMAEGAMLAVSGAVLLVVRPEWMMAALGCGAALLTTLAVYMALHNRQRAAWFQATSAAGLSSSGLVACLAVAGRIPAWGWWWWALHTTYFLTAILVVHVRLDARIRAKAHADTLSHDYCSLRREAALVQGAVVLGIGLAASAHPWYAAAVALSAAVHLHDLYTAHTARAIALPMTSVGRRALALSIAFTALLIAGAWREQTLNP